MVFLWTAAAHFSFRASKKFRSAGAPDQISPSRGGTGPLSNTVLLGMTRVSLINGISFRPTVLAWCTSVTDGQTDHATVTWVAIGRIAIAMPPNNGHKSQDTQTEIRTPGFHLTLSPSNARISAQTLHICIARNYTFCWTFCRWQYGSILTP